MKSKKFLKEEFLEKLIGETERGYLAWYSWVADDRSRLSKTTLSDFNYTVTLDEELLLVRDKEGYEDILTYSPKDLEKLWGAIDEYGLHSLHMVRTFLNYNKLQ